LASLDRSAIPLVPAEPARAHAFEAPLLLLAALARHLHPEEGVRLGPLELVHGAFELLLLAPLEHRRRVMSEGAGREDARGDHGRDGRGHGARLRKTWIRLH